MATTTTRPVDSGRRDSKGRPIKVSGQSAANRSDAPPPPDSDTASTESRACSECGADTKRKTGLCRKCDPSSKRNRRNAGTDTPGRGVATIDNPAGEIVGPDVKETDTIYGPMVKGSNYDISTDITDISKSVKQRFKALQNAGNIPAGWKIKSKLERYAGGQAINLTVEVDEPVYTLHPDLYWNHSDESMLIDYPHPDRPGETVDLVVKPNEQVNIRADSVRNPNVWKHVDDLSAYLDTFNRSQKEAMVDYFDSKFSGRVRPVAPNHPTPRPEFRPIP